jgi:hypothetical protein
MSSGVNGFPSQIARGSGQYKVRTVVAWARVTRSIFFALRILSCSTFHCLQKRSFQLDRWPTMDQLSGYRVAAKLEKKSLMIAINVVACLSIFFFGYDQ